MRPFIVAGMWLVLTSWSAAWVRAELTPDEIAIVAVRDSRESRAVAEYYAKARQVPTSQILLLGIPAGQQIQREDWDKQVRPAVRRWLTEKQLSTKIRCFVTVWDVPLKIAASSSNPQLEFLGRYLADERKARIARLNDLLGTLQAAADDDGASATAPLPADAKLEQIKNVLDPAFSAAQTRALQLQDEQQKTQALQQLQLVYFRAVGLNMMLQSMSQQLRGADAANAKLRTEFDYANGRMLGLREGRAAIEGLAIGIDRESQLLALIERSDGLFGTIAWIDEQLGMVEKNETYASFDSELSLVAWPDYELIRWQPNQLHYRFDGSPVRDYRKTFMVAQLEAPTLRITRSLIDQSVEVEKQGLTGKVYLDARGLAKLEDTNVQPNSYADYDQSLLRTAELVKQHTNLEVVLDTQQELFAEDSCPQAALYCGWYSLAKYRDAFQWQPGAVGYHMASSEASTLRDTASEVWCKRMLEDGVVATLGPTHEPYISAFPRPMNSWRCCSAANTPWPRPITGRYPSTPGRWCWWATRSIAPSKPLPR